MGFESGVGGGGQGASPGDVAVAGGVVVVAAFGEDPLFAGIEFAQGEVVGGDVLLAEGEAFFGGGELVHQGEAEVVFFGGEIDGGKAGGKVFGGFPADLAAEAGFVAGGADGGELAEEAVEDGFEEVPIIGAAGKEGAEPKFGAFGLVYVDGGEVAFAGGGDIKAEAEWGGME